jgi:hypothetical protein
MATLMDQTKNVQGETEAQELERLRAENKALKDKANGGGTFKVKISDKGAVSVYGLGRFPVTLYRSQWERLLHPSHVQAVLAFIAANADRLKSKDD